MTLEQLAIYVLGVMSGVGIGYSLGLKDRRKPSPPPRDVAEETMQQFERIMEGKTAMDRKHRQPEDVVH